MKKIVLLIVYTFFAFITFGQTSGEPDKNKKTLIVEAACGECKLGLKGESCDLAVRINGRSYFVDGTNIDSHGDAHAQDGFCKAIRMAKVQGEIVNDRFKASYFQLIPDTKKINKSGKT